MSQMVGQAFCGHPMGIYLPSNQSVSYGQTDAQVTGMVALPSFPGTAVVGGKAVADGGQKTWSATGKVTLSAAYSGGALSIYIMQNSTAVTGGAWPSGATSATFNAFNITLSTGDTFWLAYTSGFVFSVNMVGGQTSTYIQFS